jgi:hypothetical protein
MKNQVNMKSETLHFIASVNDDRVKDIKTIAANLQKLGCHIDSVLSFSGIITGSTVTALSLNQLKIDGIKHVEKSREVRAI